MILKLALFFLILLFLLIEENKIFEINLLEVYCLLKRPPVNLLAHLLATEIDAKHVHMLAIVPSSKVRKVLVTLTNTLPAYLRESFILYIALNVAIII